MTETKEKTKKSDLKLDPEEMVQAGLHFGHKSSRIHPKIKPYLYGTRNGVNIFDTEKTAVKLKEALDFIKKIVADEKVLVLVGTKVQIKALVESTAKECGLSYVTDRWLGGTFTNFETIKKRVDYFKDLEQKKSSGELEKYTKKERAQFAKELEILRLKFEGLKDMQKLPDAIFIADMKGDELALKEAKKKGIPIIGIADTNIDPTLANYPIPANDDAVSSVKYILDKIKEVVLKAKKEVKPKKDSEPEKK